MLLDVISVAIPRFIFTNSYHTALPQAFLSIFAVFKQEEGQEITLESNFICSKVGAGTFEQIE